MRLMALAVLALSGLVYAESTELVDGKAVGTVAGRHYGTSVALGQGRARTYVEVDPRTGNPVEVGVAMDEAAMEGLPEMGNMGGGGHEHYNSYILELPAGHRTPYQFVELDWNPRGHGGPYTAAHFDFHFYRVSLAERDAIDPARTDYAEQAAALPSAEELPAGYAAHHALMNISPAEAAVPRMGLHWIDTSSPELPPRNQPFTATFIVGSWGGKVIFDEPMITRDFILAQADRPAGSGASFPVSASKRYSPAGFYMDGYRVSFDEATREYRVALTGLAWKE
jgi:hypothetical protein